MDYDKASIFLFLSLSFIGGLFISSLEIHQLVWLIFFILSLLIYVFKRKLIVLSFCLLFIAAGFIYYQFKTVDLTEIAKPNIEYFSGQIIKEPDLRQDQVKLTVENDKIGRVLITTNKENTFKYGDKIKVRGQIKIPKNYNDFDYRKYLAKDGVYYVSYWPTIEIVEKNQGFWLYEKIFNLKNVLRGRIEKIWPSPTDNLIAAILIGDKRQLSASIQEGLNLVGLRHVAAISGMHMVIWSQIFLYLFLALGLSRPKAFYFVSFLLFGYVFLIGWPASAVRAMLMALLLLMGQKLGRVYSGSQAVVLAALIMLLFNPLLLRSDVGFQLSFVAVLSIIHLKPFFDEWLSKIIPSELGLRDVLSLTLAAQIGVLPFLIWHFGYFSLVAPISNLFFVPILPLIMVLSLGSVFLSFISFGLAKLIGWLVYLPMSFLLKMIDVVSLFPLAQIKLKTSWLILPAYYLILFFLVKKILKKPAMSWL